MLLLLEFLPRHTFSKISSFHFLSTFNARLINQKRIPYTQQFDLFLLCLDPASDTTSLIFHQSSDFIHGIYIGEDPELVAQAFTHLGSHAISYSSQNRQQAKIPSHQHFFFGSVLLGSSPGRKFLLINNVFPTNFRLPMIPHFLVLLISSILSHT